MDSWVQVPAFGGGQYNRSKSFEEPVPVPETGDGVFGGAIYGTWIDFGTIPGPGGSIQLVFSTAEWVFSS